MINRRPSNEISLPQMYDSGIGGFSVQRGGERSLLAAEKMECRNDRKCQGQPEREGKERNNDGRRRRREEEETIGEIGWRKGRSGVRIWGESFRQRGEERLKF